ncbi:hypothetical protein A2116_00010 [Candidatus Jorgensenbacteria bacterium GWA1_49_17]|uniref:Uncharacterized protein n=1 Tax=Candidatus Jorgensenbacteria bacterium GWA1_49_17 TaxID=1798467 RepID=A0A1F6BTK9_9BACT|nr:MAG: hypothetical protein A2116_00010 [Candidatus Jorgensenbacteria bacterium GWA1_49_17]
MKTLNFGVVAVFLFFAFVASACSPDTSRGGESARVTSPSRSLAQSPEAPPVERDSLAIFRPILESLSDRLEPEADIYAVLESGSAHGSCENWLVSSPDDYQAAIEWFSRHPEYVNVLGTSAGFVRRHYRERAIAGLQEQLQNARRGVLETDCDGVSTFFLFDDALAHVRALQIPPEEIEDGLTVAGLRQVMARLVGFEAIKMIEDDRYWGLSDESGEGAYLGKPWYRDYGFTCTEMGLNEAHCRQVTEPPDRG